MHPSSQVLTRLFALELVSPAKIQQNPLLPTGDQAVIAQQDP
jgi:hypothetical protein